MLLGKLARLSPREWSELLQAQLALVVAQILVKTRPTGRLLASAHAPPSPPAASRDPGTLDPRATSLALAVGRAAEHGIFRPLCLVRAVALQRLLEAHGIRGSRIRVGVRMTSGRFAAHAWVECGTQILGDSEWHVNSFAELAEIELVESR